MSQSITCQHCGFEVRFDEGDRGFEVYCDSCGRANLIPTLPEAAQDNNAPASGESATESDATRAVVFSSDGTVEIEQQVVGEEVCLCGAKVPVRVEDYGSTVYCPHCATEIQVGQTLGQAKFSAAKSAAGERASEDGTLPPKTHFRLFGSPVGLMVLFLIGTSAGVGGYLTWQHPETLAQTFGWSPKAVPRNLIEPVRNDRPPNGSGFGPAKQFTPVPDPEITLECIEKLLKHPHVEEALVQAQVWQESLRDQGVGADDPRLRRLANVIDTLTAKFAPKPQGPPSQLKSFRKLLDKIAKALKLNDLKGAREALTCAEKFLEEHHDELSPYCHRLFSLKTRLRQQEAKATGGERIRKLLAKSDDAQASGRVTVAMEARAKARFLAPITPLSDAEFQELDQKDRTLAAAIRFERGARAVKEALACNRENDRITRNREARRAFELLAGSPERKIKHLLDQVRPWAENNTGRHDPSTGNSAIARKIDQRNLYEDILTFYGDCDYPKLVQAASKQIEATSSREAQPASVQQKIQDALFDVLERTMMAKIDDFNTQEGEKSLRKNLHELRDLLDSARPWRTHHQWKALDAIVRQQGNRLAKNFLEEAIQLVEKNDFEEAARRAAEAEGLGGPQVAQKARQIAKQCQDELKLRADRQAQEKYWQRIKALQSRGNKLFELWKELELFSRRFPNNVHAEQIERLKNQMRPTLEEKSIAGLIYVKKLIKRNKWVLASKYVALLKYAPLSRENQVDLDRIVQQINELKKKAELQFFLLGEYKKLVTEQDVLILLEKLPGILGMDPDHDQAKQLMKRAKNQGAIRAEKLLNSAIRFRYRRPAAYIDKLQRAAKLDPSGPYGKKAKQLLRAERQNR